MRTQCPECGHQFEADEDFPLGSDVPGTGVRYGGITVGPGVVEPSPPEFIAAQEQCRTHLTPLIGYYGQRWTKTVADALRLPGTTVDDILDITAEDMRTARQQVDKRNRAEKVWISDLLEVRADRLRKKGTGSTARASPRPRGDPAAAAAITKAKARLPADATPKEIGRLAAKIGKETP